MQIRNSEGKIACDVDYNVGDIVCISNSGKCYTTYEEAYRFFGLDYNRRDMGNYCKRDQLYHVIGFVEHGCYHRIICGIKNIANGRVMVIGIDGLTPCKSYSLRYNKSSHSEAPDILDVKKLSP